MHKIFAAVVASVFTLGSVGVLAADALRRDEMTTQEKAELRQRADRLVAERAQKPEQDVVRRNEARPQAGQVTLKPAAKKTKKANTKKTRRHVSQI